MDWVVIAIPVLIVAAAVYWLRQPLIYDLLYLLTREYAIWHILQNVRLVDIEDLAGIRMGFTHYGVGCGGLQYDLDMTVTVVIPEQAEGRCVHSRGVWPEALYQIDRLTFDRNRRGSEGDRVTGRALDLSSTIVLLLNRYYMQSV